jgi:hypothetical protein
MARAASSRIGSVADCSTCMSGPSGARCHGVAFDASLRYCATPGLRTHAPVGFRLPISRSAYTSRVFPSRVFPSRVFPSRVFPSPVPHSPSASASTCRVPVPPPGMRGITLDSAPIVCAIACHAARPRPFPCLPHTPTASRFARVSGPRPSLASYNFFGWHDFRFVPLTPLHACVSGHCESSLQSARQNVPVASFVQIAPSSHSSVEPALSHVSPIPGLPQPTLASAPTTDTATTKRQSRVTRSG